METAFITSIILLTGFSLLAMFDGVYLHLFRYKLFANPESRNEHISHSIRALLFPGILYFLYSGNTGWTFGIGLALVFIDIIVLGADAYMEKDSRAFMGGLPRWEYIIHLMVNGFHFASIAVFIIIKIRFTANGYVLVNDFNGIVEHKWFTTLVTQLIPGGIILALIHLLLLFPKPIRVYNRLALKLKCCQPS
jgi:hypothetical protein